MSNVQAKLDAVRKKIVELQATEKKLVDELAGVVDASKIKQGDTVTFATGKGATRKDVSGLVIGIKEPNEGDKVGRLFRVAVGEGFDSEAFTVSAGGIKGHVPAVIETAEAVSA